jgi:hypothetical protein
MKGEIDASAKNARTWTKSCDLLGRVEHVDASREGGGISDRNPPMRPGSAMMRRGNHQTKGTTTMGDKSPKAAKKQASQKQIKSNQADNKKRQDVAAKQAPPKKK